jgi:hypothetical protein
MRQLIVLLIKLLVIVKVTELFSVTDEAEGVIVEVGVKLPEKVKPNVLAVEPNLAIYYP